MCSSWKLNLEALETRETPAVLGLIGHAAQIVFPPTDPTSPPPPPPPSGGGIIVIVAPPTSPWIPGAY